MDDLTKEFLIESHEGLDCMERGLNGLQRDGDPAVCLAEIFRAVHTMKGTVGFLGFTRLEQLAHAGEALLAQVRDGVLSVDGDLIDLMMQLADRLRLVLQLIDERGHEGKREIDDDAALIEVLQRVANGGKVLVQPQYAAASAREEMVSGERAVHAVESSVRVEVEVLNRLMNLVGELVQTRNQFLKAEISEDSFTQLGQRLDGVTARLRETVMQARMQPVGQLFQRFPRLARDVAASCGKRVKLEFHGGETGLDKSLLEMLKDPIAHAVRNAIDHGIELPQVRFPMGKTADGNVELRAYHDGGQIVVEVKDDGAGIDCAKVMRRAVERGVISEERARSMSDADAMELLFQPGFSTNDEVTMISGRGVGMDVVRANVESIGGSVELQSVLGEGTTVRMRVPLTLAIVPALIARCGGEMFALPHSTLLEMMLVHKREEARVVQRVGNARMAMLRDRMVPLLDLSEVLEVEADHARGYYIAILETKGRQFGVIVDDMAEPQEIVVKPLSSALGGLNLYSGATILGDGQIALILDTAGLARRAKLGDAGETMMPARAVVEIAKKPQGAQMLVFANVAMERAAVPLACVERIEWIAAEDVERMAGEGVVQYRGDVVRLEDAGGLMAEAREPWLVLICNRPEEPERRVGLVVREVMDVAEGERMAGSASRDEGVVRVNGKIAFVYRGFEGVGDLDRMLQEAA
jgi:two-component system chemotaxis sensor kinase CheA